MFINTTIIGSSCVSSDLDYASQLKRQIKMIILFLFISAYLEPHIQILSS